MHTTKLARWGNSQGIIIPKHLCEHVGMKVGDRVEIAVDAASGTIEVAPAASMDEQAERGSWFMEASYRGREDICKATPQDSR